MLASAGAPSSLFAGSAEASLIAAHASSRMPVYSYLSDGSPAAETSTLLRLSGKALCRLRRKPQCRDCAQSGR